ncbi:hypothetical protein J6590_079175 [Homalodisca vitripennis]|nr:hypothetical protein J6590_079175 [Homalodisca vitripennis]
MTAKHLKVVIVNVVNNDKWDQVVISRLNRPVGSARKSLITGGKRLYNVLATHLDDRSPHATPHSGPGRVAVSGLTEYRLPVPIGVDHHIPRAPHAVEEWGDQARRRERVGMEGPLLPTTAHVLE